MLQLHQQRQAARASAHLTSSLVLPPDSEIVAPVSIRSPSGIQLGWCSLIEPQIALTEIYGVLVGHTLIDHSGWSASVLLVNPGSDVVVLPSFSSWCRCRQSRGSFGDSLSEGWSDLPGAPGRHCCRLSSFLGRRRADDAPKYILHQYAHMFPAPGEPVTGRTTAVQHEIQTSDARPVQCGPRRLSPARLRTEQTCIQEMLEGGQIEPVIVLGLLPWF